MRNATEDPVLAEDFDLQVSSGRIHAERFGRPDAPLVIAVPGLSANMKSYDFIGERVGGSELQVVAMDLRGRGMSETTAPGTYGWVNHATDVVAVADALGAQKFSVLGQSMGGAVGMGLFAQPSIQNGTVGVDATIAEERPIAPSILTLCRIAFDD